jgi:hypothetical protein
MLAEQREIDRVSHNRWSKGQRATAKGLDFHVGWFKNACVFSLNPNDPQGGGRRISFFFRFGFPFPKDFLQFPKVAVAAEHPVDDIETASMAETGAGGADLVVRTSYYNLSNPF